MTVTEHLMKPGRFDLKFTQDASFTAWSAVNEFDHIVITPTRLDAAAATDAQILAKALYTGVVQGRPTPRSVSGYGLAWWLGTDDGRGDLLDTKVSNTAANLGTWITSLRPSSLSAGTVTSPAGTLTQSFQWTTRREAIDYVCRHFGAEWRVNPAGTLDAGTAANLFTTTPNRIIARRQEGYDGALRGLDAVEISRARDVEGYTSKVIAVGKRGDGAEVATGSATGANVYKDLFNNNVVLERLANAPDLPAASTSAYAASVLGMYDSIRQSITLSSATYAVPLWVRPGDYVYAYDQAANLIDRSIQVNWRGRLITPVKLRCRSYTWPIARGMGVYLRRSAATPTYVDLTDFVEWETSPTRWEVGTSIADPSQDPQQLGAAYLGVNPEIVNRLSGPEWITSSAPTLTNVTGGAVTGLYKQTAVDEIEFIVEITAGTATAATTVTVTIPGGYTAVGIQPVGALLSVGGIVSTTTSCRTNVGSGSITLYASTGGANFGVGDSVICRITGHAIRI